MVTSLVALVALGLQAAPTPFTLKYVPLLNDGAKYNTIMSITKDGVSSTIESVVEHTVVDVQGDGSYTMRSSSNGSVMRTGGQGDARNDTPTSIDMVFAPDGKLVRALSPNAGAVTMRVGSMIRFVSPDHPITVGDEYTIDRDGDGSGLPSSTTKYKFERLVGTGTRGLAVLSVNYKETSGDAPATAVGEWQIDTYTGLMVSLDLKISGFTSPIGDVTGYQLKKIDQKP